MEKSGIDYLVKGILENIPLMSEQKEWLMITSEVAKAIEKTNYAQAKIDAIESFYNNLNNIRNATT